MTIQPFDAAIYSARRQQLMRHVNKGLVLLMGNEESSMNYRDNWYPFRQDSTFLYYIGIDISGLAAVLDIDEGRVIVFGQELSMDDIIWTGPLPTLRELAQQVGITESGSPEQLAALLKQAQQAGRRIHILPPYRPENSIRLSGLLNVPAAQLETYISKELIFSVIQQREIKEPVEVEEMDRAVDISNAMHLAVIHNTRSGLYEYELAATAEAVAMGHWGRVSYPTILTINGQTLHNHFHGNRIKEGQLLLCDAGAETARHYAGDLTRTIPVGKQFTTRQQEIYETVLQSMNHAIDLLRPGITFKEVHTQACIQLMKGLQQIGLIKGDAEEAVAADVHTLFFQCGLGHMIGLDVHDMEDLGEQYVGYSEDLQKGTAFGWKSLRLGKALKAGFTLTIEPGIYIIPELIDRWKAENKHTSFVNYSLLEEYRQFGGIRIEDNYLITENGSRKLGQYLPKTLQEIEALRAAALEAVPAETV